MAAVRATGLVKQFESTRALDGVDLVVQAGELRGLLGPNGAGKTTLLRLLFGLTAPDAGSVELLGRPLGAIDSVHLDGVAGFVEEPAFYPYLSGRANLELLAELDRSRAARARVGEALELLGLAERAGDRVSGYSTGMRQRLGIAAALLRAPQVLLLDEPTSGLDPAGVREVSTVLRRLASEGTAVLLSSHRSAAQLREQAPGSAYRLRTSDDARALDLVAQHPGVDVLGRAGGELRLAVQAGALDPFVLELGRNGVAVRRLELLLSPLESMFFALTGEPVGGSAALAELAEAILAGT